MKIFFLDLDVPVCDEVSCGETLGGSVTSYYEKRSSKEASSNCKCQCLKHLQTFREDKGFCVDTIEGNCYEERNLFDLNNLIVLGVLE
jgi:hypothetical protein